MRLVRTSSRLLAVPALLLGIAVVAAPAEAAATQSLGDVSVTPASGNDLTVMTLLTTASCPVPSTNAFATLSGPGLPADGTGLVVVPNTAISVLPRTQAGGLALPMNNTLRTLVDLLPDPQPLQGSYTIDIQCRAGAKVADLGDFTGTLVFDGHRGWKAKEPAGVPAASLVTVAPRTDPPIPTAGATASGSTHQPTLPAPAAAVARQPKATKAATRQGGVGEAAPWLIGGGALLAALGVASVIRTKRSARRTATVAKSQQKAAAR